MRTVLGTLLAVFAVLLAIYSVVFGFAVIVLVTIAREDGSSYEAYLWIGGLVWIGLALVSVALAVARKAERDARVIAQS